MSLLTPEPVELSLVEAAIEKEGEGAGKRGGVAASMQGEALQHLEGQQQQQQKQEGLQLAAHPSKAPAEADEPGAGPAASASVTSFKSPTLFKSAFTGKLWRSEDLPGGGTSMRVRVKRVARQHVVMG